jgi:hypothetical protein
MAVDSTPFVPKASGLAAIAQFACSVSVTLKVAVAVPLDYTAASASGTKGTTGKPASAKPSAAERRFLRFIDLAPACQSA